MVAQRFYRFTAKFQTILKLLFWRALHLGGKYLLYLKSRECEESPNYFNS